VQVSGRDRVSARVTDISEGGAWLAEAPDLPVGSRGSLSIDRVGFPLPFTVQAAHNGTLHIAFSFDAATAERFGPLPERLAIGGARSRKAA
jgi:hypothetical protein